MAQNIPLNTEFFRYRTIEGSADPIVRAISFALDQSCEKTLADLAILAEDTGVHADAPIVYYRYLLRNGWVRQKQPKQENGKRFTAAQWLALNPKMPMLLFMARHTSFADGGRIHDCIDRSARTITGLWVRRADLAQLAIRNDYASGLHGVTPYHSPKRWDKPAIRRILEDCDSRTGLSSATLPLHYYTGTRALGRFSYGNHSGGSIHLNIDYFDSPFFPPEEAEDTIRHECAHYVDKMKFGNMGHGATWKKACRMVGANPERYYSEARSEKFRLRSLEDHARNSAYDAYGAGICIVHPRFGEGEVIRVNGEGTRRNIDVDFTGCGMKKLGIQWVSEHCSIRAA